MVGPYDLTTHDGNRVDWLTKKALLECERRLGYSLTIVQGSYNGTRVSASAGTHSGGGAVDLTAADHVRKVRVLREVGFAAWYRPTLYRNGRRLWSAHIHAVLMGNERMSYGASRQVTSYRRHRDGLAGDSYDPTWRPSPFPKFRWSSSTPAPKPRKVVKDMTPDQIATALVTVKVGADNKLQKKELQDVLADLENTQDGHTDALRELGESVARIEKLLKLVAEKG